MRALRFWVNIIAYFTKRVMYFFYFHWRKYIEWKRGITNMTVWYYKDINGEVLGSVHKKKIEFEAKMNFTTAKSCDIADFKGHLMNSDWE